MKLKNFAKLSLAVALLTSAAAWADETPELPGPTKEHEWLKQLVGEWESESEIVSEPGQEPVKAEGAETVRAIGGFWVLAENNGKAFEHPFTGLLTLGYDATKEKYVGTWVDSMTSYLWVYEGTLDESGKKLTLTTRGPCHQKEGELADFKETLEIKGKDHKVFTSSVQGEDGKWTTFMTINYHRKK